MILATIGPGNYLAISAILFALGVFAVISRRNAIAVLMGIELMLNAASLNFVVFWRFLGGADLTGPIFALIVITVAAAEAAIGLAIVLSVYRRFRTVNVDEVDLMEG
jgi:NADH-quinone oxidoreductase subunit K